MSSLCCSETENPDSQFQLLQVKPAIRPEQPGRSTLASRLDPDVQAFCVSLISACVLSENELETEPTEPGPLGKKSSTSLVARQRFSGGDGAVAVQIAERSSIPAPDSTLFTSHANSV